MALKLRRGTDAERQTITPAAGELIYTTDLKEVWVGDGTTQGGILVSAEVSDDTTPQLGGNLDLNGNDIVGTGNINITGTITATGTVNLGDGAEDNVIVGGQIGSSLIPRVDESYDLGAVASRWRNIYAGGGVIDGSLDIGTLVLDGNIIKSDSTIIYNGNSNLLDADLTGSVFGDDSTLLVDGVNSVIPASALSGTATIDITGDAAGVSNSALTIAQNQFESPTGALEFTGNSASGSQAIFNFEASPTTGGSIFTVPNLQRLDLRTYGGTLENKVDLSSGDILGSIGFLGVQVSTGTELASGIGFQVDPDGSLSSTHIPTKFFIYTMPSISTDEPHLLTFNSEGRLAVNREDADASLHVNGDAIISGGITGDLIGSVFSDNSTRIIDGETGSIVNLDFQGQTGNTPTDAINVDSWLEVTVNGNTKYIPLYD